MYKRESGFMEKHPDRVAQAERIQELSRQLNEGVVSFTTTLDEVQLIFGPNLTQLLGFFLASNWAGVW